MRVSTLPPERADYPLLTEQDAAKRLNVSLALLRKLRREGRGPSHVRIGNLVRYRTDALPSWLASLPR